MASLKAGKNVEEEFSCPTESEPMNTAITTERMGGGLLSVVLGVRNHRRYSVHVWLLLALSISSPTSAETSFKAVHDGNPDPALDHSGWKKVNGALEGSGLGLLLKSTKSIGKGEARIRAKFALDKLNHTAASIVFGGRSHFGFDGSGKKLFVEGPLFSKLTFLDTDNPIQDNKPFVFEMVRKDGRLSFSIDGNELHTIKDTGKPLGEISLRPHRATMRVFEFTLEGNLMEPPRPMAGIVDIFKAGTDGYHTFRIPVMTVTKRGTILAFCEGRKSGRGDAGNIDTVLKRSEDGGKTWSALQVVWDDSGNTCGNPCPVVDQSNGIIWLLSTWNLGSDHESAIMSGKSKFPRKPFVSKSEDDGQTWSPPTELPHCRKEDWRWYATGPVHGIQLQRGAHKGRLVIPANHSVFEGGRRDPRTYHSHILYSDDHGKTWSLGGIHDGRTNESTVVELSDGSVMQNMRSYHGKNRRAVATSKDGGLTWTEARLDEELVEPVCQASIHRFSWPEDGRSRILFSNPASRRRDHMTVRVSYDEGNTWPVSRLIYEGSAAYSNLAKLPDGRAGLLFERDGYKKISFVPFGIEWLEGKSETP